MRRKLLMAAGCTAFDRDRVRSQHMRSYLQSPTATNAAQ